MCFIFHSCLFTHAVNTCTWSRMGIWGRGSAWNLCVSKYHTWRLSLGWQINHHTKIPISLLPTFCGGCPTGTQTFEFSSVSFLSFKCPAFLRLWFIGKIIKHRRSPISHYCSPLTLLLKCHLGFGKRDKAREAFLRAHSQTKSQMETRGKVQSTFKAAGVEGKRGKPGKEGQGRSTGKGQRGCHPESLSIGDFREAGRSLGQHCVVVPEREGIAYTPCL